MGVIDSEADGRVQIALDGELDLTTAPLLERALTRAVASGAEITVDLSECSFMDACGIRVLVDTARSLEPDGRKLAVVGLSGQPERIFSMLLSYLRPFEIQT